MDPEPGKLGLSEIKVGEEPDAHQKPEYLFKVDASGLSGTSGLIGLVDLFPMEVAGPDGEPLADAGCVLHLPAGTTRGGGPGRTV